MKCLWMLGRRGDVGLQNFEDEEVVFVDEAIVGEPAFEIGVTFANERRPYTRRLLARELEAFELIDLRARSIANSHHDLGECRRRQIDHAFPAPADQIVAIVAAGNDAADQGRRELHDGMPAHGHNVALAAMGRGDEHDRTRLEIAANLRYRQINLVRATGHGSYTSTAILHP